jgi:hypothetical protein
MRLWSLHPRYLDARGLVALWREALLAQAVLRGRTKGYTRHPQLLRFQEQDHPAAYIAEYLRSVREEAEKRGYHFAARKIGRVRPPGRLTVARGQLQFEWHHLLEKVRKRDPKWFARLLSVENPQPHPLFRAVPGGVAPWEKGMARPLAALPRHKKTRIPPASCRRRTRRALQPKR